jgi:hypothetical protein
MSGERPQEPLSGSNWTGEQAPDPKYTPKWPERAPAPQPVEKQGMSVRRKLALVIGGLIVGASLVLSGRATAPGAEQPKPTPTGETATPTPSMAAGETPPTLDGVSIGEIKSPDCVIHMEGTNVKDTILSGLPSTVDAKTVDQSNHKPFSHKIGLGSQMILGEPGGLLVGPDFDPKKVASSKGMIQYLSGENQAVIHSTEPFSQNIPEGGFMYASLMEGKITIGDDNDKDQIKLVLPEVEDNNYLVYIRGLYPNQNPDTQNTDRNKTAVVTCAVPGHALLEEYKSGTSSNMAFISEKQFEQQVKMSETGGTNLGAGGASRTTAVFLDLNTKAFTVITKEANQKQDPGTDWTIIGTNLYSLTAKS